MAERRQRLKIVVTGPVGSGKTTAITAISDRPPLSTDEIATDEVALRKKHTTVAFDFGVVELGNGDEVHLYGTPGQERFDFMWDVVSTGAVGVIILLDCTMPAAPEVLGQFVSAFSTLIRETALVVGLSHTDLVPSVDLAPFHAVLASEGIHAPVLSVDPRSRRDVAIALESLLAVLDPDLVA